MSVKEHKNNPEPGSDEHLFEEAAALLLRVHEPDSGLAELEEFEAWQGRSPRHLAVAAELQKLWVDVGRVQDLPWPSPGELAGDITSDAGKRLRNRSRARPRYRAAVFGSAIAASIAACFALALHFFSAETIYETGVGEHQLIHLDDGSEITLGAMSRVHVEYGKAERLVRLELGEGLFTVQKDANRPFYVQTDDVSVQAVGTAFNVRKGLERVVVSVVEGTVRVSRPATSQGEADSPGLAQASSAAAEMDQDVVAGEQLTIVKDDPVAGLRASDVANAAAWRDGRFVFSGEPLASVVAELNRYSRAHIEITDGELGDLTFSGTVLRGKIDEWLRGLEYAFPVRVELVGDTGVIIRERREE